MKTSLLLVASVSIFLITVPVLSNEEEGVDKPPDAGEKGLEALTERLQLVESKLEDLDVNRGSGNDNDTAEKAVWIITGIASGILVFLLIRSGAQRNTQKTLESIEKTLRDLASTSTISPPPYIDEVDPTSGPVTGDIKVKIKGGYFDKSTEVRIGGHSCAVDSRDNSGVTIVVPAALNYTAGETDLVLETNTGSVARKFTYIKARLTADPITVPVSGGWHELTGVGFSNQTRVYDGNDELPTGYISGTKMIVSWPGVAAATKRKFRVSREDRESCTVEIAYRQ